MQDLRTGELHELPIPADVRAMFDQLPAREQREHLQAAADKIIPDRRNQGPVFLIGETLEIRGGKFRIVSLAGGEIRLKSLPR